VKLKPKVTKIEKKAPLKKKVAAALPEVELAQELSVPDTNIRQYVLWFYGSPGIGKTSLASMFEDVHFLMFEPGGKALRIYQKPMLSWPEYRAYLKALGKGGHRFKGTVTDVVEKAHAMCFSYMCKKLVISHPADVQDFGKSWGAIMNEFLEAMVEQASLPDMGTILISHAAMTKRKTRTGEEVEDIHPALSGKPLEALEGAVDLLGYMHIRRGHHVMQIRADDSIMAKCRFEENFRYTDGSPITYIPLGESKQEAYENFIAAYNNELSPPEKETLPVPKSKKIVKKK
jgi:hypothetical protein